jgi:hypothetical protein
MASLGDGSRAAQLFVVVFIIGFIVGSRGKRKTGDRAWGAPFLRTDTHKADWATPAEKGAYDYG